MVRDRFAFGLGALLLQAFCIFAVPSPAHAAGFFSRLFEKDPLRQVVVTDPYLEMHTGPGVGYPVFNVVGRGETIEILKRRTDWFYVRTSRDLEGWVGREQILATLETTGEPVDIKEPTRANYATRRYEGGVFAGRFGGASLLSIYGGYGLSEHLTAEISISNAIGNVSDAWMASAGLNHTFAPEWWVSPYFGLGTGVIKTQPRVTLVQASDSTDQIGYFSAGARGYLARRFLWRFEYRGNVVFTSRNENEEIHEWKLGFAFFF